MFSNIDTLSFSNLFCDTATIFFVVHVVLVIVGNSVIAIIFIKAVTTLSRLRLFNFFFALEKAAKHFSIDCPSR